ncbi:head GIN domain-containing protein [Hymenobacter saemangeumensis]|uniref:Head GIN domain-containing protein n=1 Tax=Hymenobacter saemangeumensis TaxID=1084522 RepID=A0ABP8HZF3_9BACT
MKRFSLVLLTLLATAGTTLAQTKQSRTPGSFRAVEAGGGIDVFLAQGPSTAVVVEADNDVQRHLITEVKGGTLVINWEKGYSWKNLLSSNRKANVYVTAPQLEAVTASGGSDVRGQSPIKATSFRVTASGGSDVTLTLNASTLSGTASGGSDLRLDGRVERQTVSVSGGADYLAFGLQSKAAVITASGGADANVSVDDELSATASGGSDVRYKGQARVLKSNASGGSSVRRAQ